MPLTFADISSHQTVNSWPTFLNSVDGVVTKISEGTGYYWAGATAALSQARAAGKLVGAYHYAGASGHQPGDPVAEADYFLSHYQWRPGEVPILDYEPAVYPADPDGWAFAWLSRVRSKLGVVPMIYLNHYFAVNHSAWTRTRTLGPGLWSAWYGANTGAPLTGEPSFAPWTEAMWQYTSNGSKPGISYPLDLSEFYGTAAQWRAYGTPTPAEDGTFMGITFNTMADFQDAVARAVLCYVPADRPTGADGKPSPWLWDQVAYMRSQVQGPLTEFDGRSLVQGIKHVTDEELLPALQALAGDVATLKATVSSGGVDASALATALASNPDAIAKLGKAIADSLSTRLGNG